MGVFSVRVVLLCQILLLALESNCFLLQQRQQVHAPSRPWQSCPRIRCHGIRRFYPALVYPRTSSSCVELNLANNVENNAKRDQDKPKKKNAITKLLARLILDHPIWEQIKTRFFLVTRGRHRYWFYVRKWLRSFYQKSNQPLYYYYSKFLFFIQI